MQLRDMVYHQTPQKFRGHIVVGMDNPIAGTNDRFCIVEDNRRIML